MASAAAPGQFIQARTSDDYYPLWPRPFSIHDANPGSGDIVIVFRISGCGTSQLANKQVGQKVHLFGPLGNGFPEPREKRHMLLAAGGIGLPPLHFLARRALQNGIPPDGITFIAGAKTKAELLEQEGLFKLGVKVSVCTDDGSAGIKGLVTEIVQRHIDELAHSVVYACGPSGMLQAIDQLLLANKTPGYLSLETLMPCGYGVCSGCAVKVTPPLGRGPTDDNRDYHLKRVCCDGPIFGAGEVIWS